MEWLLTRRTKLPPSPAYHKIEKPVTVIIAGPYRANTSGGRWGVRLRDTRRDGSVVEYGKHFWRKREAEVWVEKSGFRIAG